MVRFFFFLSLTFNIVVIGAVSAYVFREPRLLQALPPVLRPHLPQPHDVVFKRIELALPKEKAAFAARELRALEEKMRGHRGRMPGLEQKIHDMFAADVFSPDAIRAAHREMQQGRADISEAFTETLLRIADGLTVKERRALADALPKRGARREHAEDKKRRRRSERHQENDRAAPSPQPRTDNDVPQKTEMMPIREGAYTPIPENPVE